MDSAFTLGEGDNAGPWRLKLRGEPTVDEPDGPPVDIAGAAIHFTMTPIEGGTPLIDHAGNNLQAGDGIANGTRGDVSYGEDPNPWGTAADSPGFYLTRVTVTFSSGDVQSYPNQGHLLLVIDPAAATTPGRYLTRDQLKDTLDMAQTNFANRDIDVAIEAASRGLEIAYGARWYVTGDAGGTAVRYYDAADDCLVALGDVLDVTELAVDFGWVGSRWGSGEYATILAATDYVLSPIENGSTSRTPPGNGEPFRLLELSRASSWRTWPAGPMAVRITGKFGWERTPAGVTAAATIVATRLLRRQREAPFGIHGVGLDQQTFRAVQFAKDPEVELAIRPARGIVRLFV
jgi:hypothetical protein